MTLYYVVINYNKNHAIHYMIENKLINACIPYQVLAKKFYGKKILYKKKRYFRVLMKLIIPQE